MEVILDLNVIDKASGDTLTATKAAAEKIEGYDVVRIVTNPQYLDADRFYILEKSKV